PVWRSRTRTRSHGPGQGRTRPTRSWSSRDGPPGTRTCVPARGVGVGAGRVFADEEVASRSPTFVAGAGASVTPGRLTLTPNPATSAVVVITTASCSRARRTTGPGGPGPPGSGTPRTGAPSSAGGRGAGRESRRRLLVACGHSGSRVSPQRLVVTSGRGGQLGDAGLAGLRGGRVGGLPHAAQRVDVSARGDVRRGRLARGLGRRSVVTERLDGVHRRLPTRHQQRHLLRAVDVRQVADARATNLVLAEHH